MPTYEYLCQDCGREFEAFHSMKDDPLADCRLCGSEGTVKRKIGRGAGIIFKGTGFYETDFKDRKGTKEVETPSAKPAGEGAKTEGATEAKPGKKAEAAPSTSTTSSGTE
jgi:putative FmdB family regulatory protein